MCQMALCDGVVALAVVISAQPKIRTFGNACKTTDY